MSTENRIHLIGDWRREEALAAEIIKPGYLIEETSAEKYQAHSTEGGRAERIVADIDTLQGNGLSDSYAVGDLVAACVENPGNEVQMFLKSGENVVVGDELISAGDGTLIKNGSEASGITVKQVVAWAREAKNLTGSGAVDTRIAVRMG